MKLSSVRLTDLVVELPTQIGPQVAEVASGQELILRLAGRTRGDAEKAGELALTFAAAALGDVGRH